MTYFPAKSGLIRCLVPHGGPADVYTLSEHTSITEQRQ